MDRLDEIVTRIYSAQIAAGIARVQSVTAQLPSVVNDMALQRDAARLLRARVREMAAGSLLRFGYDRRLRANESPLVALARSVDRDLGISFHREFPELSRCVDVVCRNLSFRIAEVISRFSSDHHEIASNLFGSAEKLDSIVAVTSDHHQKQSCVFLLRIDGKLLIYKNRPMHADMIFQSILSKLGACISGLDFAEVPMVHKMGYGWMGFVGHMPSSDLRELSQFYLRVGYMLSVLVTLRSGDHHCDNMIANGGNPFFIDLESSFIPSLIVDKRPLTRMSMKSTGVISRIDRIGEFNFDIGALARKVGATKLELGWFGWEPACVPELSYQWRDVSHSPNNPHRAHSSLNDQQFRKFLIAGYREGRRILRRLSTDLIELLITTGDKPMRIILRNTRFYQELLVLSLSPAQCKNTKSRREILQRFLVEDDPRLKPVVDQEIENLMDGEIPLFQHFPGGLTIFSDSRNFERLIRRPGLELVLRDLPKNICLCDARD